MKNSRWDLHAHGSRQSTHTCGHRQHYDTPPHGFRQRHVETDFSTITQTCCVDWCPCPPHTQIYTQRKQTKAPKNLSASMCIALTCRWEGRGRTCSPVAPREASLRQGVGPATNPNYVAGIKNKHKKARNTHTQRDNRPSLLHLPIVTPPPTRPRKHTHLDTEALQLSTPQSHRSPRTTHTHAPTHINTHTQAPFSSPLHRSPVPSTVTFPSISPLIDPYVSIDLPSRRPLRFHRSPLSTSTDTKALDLFVDHPYLRTLPLVQVLPFRRSPLSTAAPSQSSSSSRCRTPKSLRAPPCSMPARSTQIYPDVDEKEDKRDEIQQSFEGRGLWYVPPSAENHRLRSGASISAKDEKNCCYRRRRRRTHGTREVKD